MLMESLLLLTSSAVVLASECELKYGGECHTISRGCPEEFRHYSLSYCTFLEQCCYNLNGRPSKPQNKTSSEACGMTFVNDKHRIVGGDLAVLGEFPWQVSLRYGEIHICGGTLVGDQHVLTAAHCFDRFQNVRFLRVQVGTLDRTYSWEPSLVVKVDRYALHPQYDQPTNVHDIALVRLVKPLDISGSDVRAACLPGGAETFDGWTCSVTGWGSTEKGGDTSRYLRKVDVPVLSNARCAFYLGPRAGLSPQILCAGRKEGRHDACQGDSGGPLSCRKDDVWKVAGIVSSGFGCGSPNTPGIYTRVSAYHDWIVQQMKS